MKEVKEQIKKEIQVILKHFKMESAENQVYVAKTINELIKAYHNTERPRYNKKPYYKKGGNEKWMKSKQGT